MSVPGALHSTDERKHKSTGSMTSVSSTSPKTGSLFRWKRLFGVSSSKKDSSPPSKEPKRALAEKEEELPTTPRTGAELFLCATCGSCFCKEHAQDHYYSRKDATSGGALGGGDNSPSSPIGRRQQSAAATRPYPYHCLYIGVPSYVSTHAGHALPETSWGLLFPTVVVNEVQAGSVSLHKELPFYTNFEQICDETVTGVKPTMSAESPTAVAGLSAPVFSNTPSDSWSYLIWCAGCSERAIRLNGRHYDHESSRHRHVRRLGQMLAFLAYCRRSGMRLQMPAKYTEYVERKQRAQHIHQLKKSTSTIGLRKGSSLFLDTMVTEEDANPDGVRSPTFSRSGSSRALSRIEIDRVLTLAHIAGFSNPGYYCYFNSVLQCVLRCGFFCRLLLPIGVTNSPGKLTLSVCNLIHHLRRQTYQDVRNSAVYPYVGAVFRHICKLNSLFEEDEQQDAQELLLCLLNGITDEFDRGKTAAEKKMRRISFEGVTETVVVCSSCHHRALREEMFMSLSIPIEQSIEAGLQSLFAPATLKGKNRYACEQCFNSLNAKEQELHNQIATEQENERKRNKASGRKDDPNIEMSLLMKNCLYKDAEVHTSITRLGHTLAVHLLRFHYDETEQDFIKVTTPVTISTKIDLSPLVSDDVLQSYAHEHSLRALLTRFPTVERTILQEYLTRAKQDYTAATRQLQADGHPSIHSRVCSTESTRPLLSKSTPSTLAEGDRSVFDTPVTTSTSPRAGGPPAGPLSRQLRDDDVDAFAERTTRLPSLERQLVGIVSHRGSLHGGHYIAYVRHLSRPEIWFRCDDEDIDVVDEKVVLDCGAEVYLVFYE